MHIAVKVPATLNISKWIGELKGVSSFNINKAYPDILFGWQKGYGVTSFSRKNLDSIVQYIRNQEYHHKRKTTIPEFEID